MQNLFVLLSEQPTSDLNAFYRGCAGKAITRLKNPSLHRPSIVSSTDVVQEQFEQTILQLQKKRLCEPHNLHNETVLNGLNDGQ